MIHYQVRFKTSSGSEYWIDYPRWGRTTRSGGLDLLDANEGELTQLPRVAVGVGVSLVDARQGWITTTPVTEVSAFEPADAVEVRVTTSLDELHRAAMVVGEEMSTIRKSADKRKGVTAFVRDDAEALILAVERRGYRLLHVVHAD